MHKKYGYTYPSILCIKTKYITSGNNYVAQFIENHRYAFTSVSFDTIGIITEGKPLQVISENGYKVSFSGDEALTYFDIKEVELTR